MSNGKQNSGPYPGGPMEANQKSSSMPSGAAGGDGGKPDTISQGGTGASGLGGEVGKAIGSIMDMDEGVESFSKKVAYAGLYGATGGQGQLGLEDALTDNDLVSVLSKKFSEKIDKMKDTDAILKDFDECQTTLDIVLNKTNAVNAYFAFLQGKRLLRLKALRTQDNNNDWTKWISAKLPNLKKRSREKYMNIAGVPMVETHLEYGVERLAEFGSFYASKTSDEKKMMGPDPFMQYMEQFKVEMDSSYDERRGYVDAILELSKLERLGIMKFPLEVMLSFLRVQEPLTGEERKHLKSLNEKDKDKPTEIVTLLNRIIAKELKRKNLIAGTDAPPTPENSADGTQKGADNSGTGSATPAKGPNIDKLVVTLCQSLKPVASKEATLDNPLDRAALVELRVYIDQLLMMSPQEPQNAS